MRIKKKWLNTFCYLKQYWLQITRRRGTKKQIQNIQIKFILFSLPKMFESETKIHRKKNYSFQLKCCNEQFQKLKTFSVSRYLLMGYFLLSSAYDIFVTSCKIFNRQIQVIRFKNNKNETCTVNEKIINKKTFHMKLGTL